MKHKILQLGVMLTILTTSPANAQDQGWPMLAGNPQRTSSVEADNPPTSNLEIVWYKDIEPLVDAKTQIISANNHLYISTSHGLIALDLTDNNNDRLPDNPEPSWRLNTSLPLGQSPTYHQGEHGKRLYVAGFDKHLYALNPDTGKVIWTFKGNKGFSVSPLVVSINNQTHIYLGNRDGTFYTLADEGANPRIINSYKTDGSILISAAYDQPSDQVFVASMDMHAYAFNATSGGLNWRQGDTDGTGFPGDGFHSYWPVIYRDNITSSAYVIFSSGPNYIHDSGVIFGGMVTSAIEKDDLWLNYDSYPADTMLGRLTSNKPAWALNYEVLDVSVPNPTYATLPITEYFENKPHRRTTFVLDLVTGKEFTFNTDGDGKAEFAPLTWFGTHSGPHYPPVVANMNGHSVLLQATTFNKNTSTIPRGGIVGWKPVANQAQYLSLIEGRGLGTANDEPHAQSIFDNIMYTAKCCSRQGSWQNLSTGARQNYYLNNIVSGNGESLPQQIANAYPSSPTNQYPYDFPYFHTNSDPSFFSSAGTFSYTDTLAPPSGYKADQQGKAGYHGDNAPPIVYEDMIYEIRSNTLVAFAPNYQELSAQELGQDILIQPPSPEATHTNQFNYNNYLQELINQLEDALYENGQVIDLDPGYLSTGIFDFRGRNCIPFPSNYFSNIYYTYMTYTSVLPLISDARPDLAADIKAYLKDLYGESGSKIEDVPPYAFEHKGWRADNNPNNKDRDIFIKQPPEFASGSFNKVSTNYFGSFRLSAWGWEFPPHNAYAMYVYARDVSENPNAVYQDLISNSRLWPSMRDDIPSDSQLKKNPHILNAYITGHFGFLNLAKLTNHTNTNDYAYMTNQLNHLLDLRDDSDTALEAQNSPKRDNATDPSWYCHEINAATDYMYLTPELADELQKRIGNKVLSDIEVYANAVPHWFASRSSDAWGEGIVSSLYETQALFQAKAYIAGKSSSELVSFLDVPAFSRGDLFYIDNLVALLNANGSAPAPPDPTPPDLDGNSIVDIFDLNILIQSFTDWGYSAYLQILSAFD